MTYHTRDIQARCAALGHIPGPIDGIMGPRTRAAIEGACLARQVNCADDLFHRSGLHRIHLHWTAGAHGVIEMERRAYHFLIDRDGRETPGLYTPEANADTGDDHYAGHTWHANTGAIGVTCDAMAGAVEAPFFAGSAPLTWPQLHGMARTAARLCAAYDIPVTRYSVLSHAEVQPTLGITQKWKWDITWLPGMERPGDPIAVGDKLRRMVSDAMLSRRAEAA